LKVKIEKINDCERKLSIEVPYEQIQKQMDTYYTSLAKDVKIKGFRPGKAPIQVVQTRFSGEVKQKVVSRVIEEAYIQAVSDQKLVPVATPRIEPKPLEEGKPFSFTAIVEVKPEVEVKKYKNLSAEKEKVNVEAKQVEDTLKQLQESKSQLKTVEKERGVATGDHVVMDFLGTLEGKKFPGGEAKNFLYEVGSKRFVPGFEEGLMGMKLNEEKDISVTFPNDYHEKKLAGKTTNFHVTLREIKQKEVPTLNDDFAKEFPECKTLADLKNKVEKDLHLQMEQQTKQKMESQLLESLVLENEVSVPPSLVQRQYDFLTDDSKRRLQSMGLQGGQMEEMLQKWNQDLRQKALFDVKVMLLLEAIVRQEKLEASEKDLDDRLEAIAQQARATKAQVKSHYQKKGMLSQIRWQILQDKAVSLLLENAKVKEIPAQKAKK